MAEEYYPPGGFYFTVTVLGSGSALALLSGADASFQEVSGLQSEIGIEEVVEGGENRFIHRLPKTSKFSNLILKRGVVTANSFLAEWTGATIGSNLSLPIVTQNILIRLLSPSGVPTIVWAFVNAYPVRWEVGPLNSTKNEVLTERLEFTYNYFERVNLGTGAAAAVQLAKLTARLAS
jgi:phage tail-like protein